MGHPRPTPSTITHELGISRQWPKQVGGGPPRRQTCQCLPSLEGQAVRCAAVAWKGTDCQGQELPPSQRQDKALDTADLSSQGPPPLRAASVLSRKSDEPLHTPHAAWPPPRFPRLVLTHESDTKSPSYGNAAGSTAWPCGCGSGCGFCITYG